MDADLLTVFDYRSYQISVYVFIIQDTNFGLMNYVIVDIINIVGFSFKIDDV